MRPRLRLTLTRTYPFDADAVFRWCTDYSGEDAAISGGFIKKRRLLENTPGRVRLETHVRVGGEELRRVHAVRLDAAQRNWTVRIVEGHGTGSRHTYTVTPLPGGGSRLTIRFGYAARGVRGHLALWKGRRTLQAGLERMWDSFGAAMANDLA